METLLLFAAVLAVNVALHASSPTDGGAAPSALAAAGLVWSAGAAMPWVAHLAALRRPGRHVPSALLLPAAVALDGLGFVLQSTWAGLPGDPAPRATELARLHCAAMGLAALVLLTPEWLGQRLPGLQRLLLPVAGLLVVLARWGPLSRPVRGQYLNLGIGPLVCQPMEAVKLCFALWLALALAPHVLTLHRQRIRVLGVLLPRADLLGSALAGLLLLLGGVWLLRDLGASLVLGILTVGTIHAVVGSRGWLLLGSALLGGALAWLAANPAVVAPVAADRVTMWLDPWRNGLPHGAHVVQGWWHLAAGGLTGVGPAAGRPLAEGDTDLVLAVLGEAYGWVGGATWLLLLGLVVGSAFVLSVRVRTPAASLVAATLGLLIFAQWLSIGGAVLGWLPLSGLVTPFLSRGASHLLLTWAVVGLLLRLGVDGARRVHTEPLVALRSGVLDIALLAAAIGALAGARLFELGVARRWELLARDALVRHADGTLALVHARRVEELINRLPRGRVLGRDGAPLRDTLQDGALAWSPGWGTLSGPPPGRVRPEPWHVEARYDERLRGYGSLPALQVWESAPAEGHRLVGFVEGVRRQGRVGEPGTASRTLPRPDLGDVVRLLEAEPREVAAWAARPGRDLVLSVSTRAQAVVAEVLSEQAGVGTALSAAVVDVDSGRFLALAQWPDVDFGDPSWLQGRRTARATDDDPFLGRYGPWRDRTGVTAGVVQAGSIGKLYTALALAHRGFAVTGEGVGRGGGPRFGCTGFGLRTGVLLPGWPGPIRDHGWTGTTPFELADALPPSSNCWFAQAGIALGPDGMTALSRLGVEVGWEGQEFDPGEAGSRQLGATAMGQGAMALNVQQAAWLLAAVGRGGRYLACPDLELSSPCPVDIDLVENDEADGVILAGLRRVMTEGTGRGLGEDPIPGRRLYGKTGTAVVSRSPDEVGWVPSSPAAHSWMGLLVEPETNEEAAPVAPHRLAIVVLAFRGGAGAAGAGPLAVEIARRLSRNG